MRWRWRCGGDAAGVARLIGTRSAEEEVEEEIQALQGAADRGRSRLMLWRHAAHPLGLLALAVPVAAGLGILGLVARPALLQAAADARDRAR